MARLYADVQAAIDNDPAIIAARERRAQREQAEADAAIEKNLTRPFTNTIDQRQARWVRLEEMWKVACDIYRSHPDPLLRIKYSTAEGSIRQAWKIKHGVGSKKSLPEELELSGADLALVALWIVEHVGVRGAASGNLLTDLPMGHTSKRLYLEGTSEEQRRIDASIARVEKRTEKARADRNWSYGEQQRTKANELAHVAHLEQRSKDGAYINRVVNGLSQTDQL